MYSTAPCYYDPGSFKLNLIQSLTQIFNYFPELASELLAADVLLTDSHLFSNIKFGISRF
jgi:hypothetical protein